MLFLLIHALTNVLLAIAPTDKRGNCLAEHLIDWKRDDEEYLKTRCTTE